MSGHPRPSIRLCPFTYDFHENVLGFKSVIGKGAVPRPGQIHLRDPKALPDECYYLVTSIIQPEATEQTRSPRRPS